MSRSAVIIGHRRRSPELRHWSSWGWRVRVLEKEPEPGGKLQRVEEAGYRFDNSPAR